MYFLFENKDALFRSILDPLFLQYQELMAKYMGMELEAPEHGTEPDSELIKILARIRLDGCLEIIKGNYDMEYSLNLVEKIGIYANGGTGKLLQNLKELHSK